MMEAAPESAPPEPPRVEAARPSTPGIGRLFQFTGSLRRVWAAWSEQRDRLDSRAREAVPTPSIAGVMVVTVFPLMVALAISGYVMGAHRALERVLVQSDGTLDPVTRLAWSRAAGGPVHVGTQSGRVLTVDRGGAKVGDQAPRSPGAVVDIQAGAGQAVALALDRHPRLAGAPPGPVGRSLPYGPETCLSGYVWREASKSDLICVTPQSRTRAAQDNAAAARRRQPGDAVPLQCLTGFVPRDAFTGDAACVVSKTRDDTAEENRLDETRKVLPDAAREGAGRVLVGDGEVSRSLLAVSDDGSVLTLQTAQPGSRAVQQTQGPVDADVELVASQWRNGSSEVLGRMPNMKDVRALSALPGTSIAVAGNGSGAVLAIDVDMSFSEHGDPTLPAEPVGTHGAAIAGIAVAAAPGANNPRFITIADDSTLKAWRAGVNRAGRPITSGPYRSIDVRPLGSRWTAEPLRDNNRWLSVEAMSGDGTRLILQSADKRLFHLAVAGPGITDQLLPMSLQPLPEELSGPAVFAPDDQHFAAVNPVTGRLYVFRVSSLSSPETYDGLRLPLHALAFDPKSERIATVSDDGTVALLELATRRSTTYRVDFGGKPVALAFSRDGSMMAVGTKNGVVSINQTSDGTQLGLLQPSTSPVAALAFDQAGKQLIVTRSGYETIERYSMRDLSFLYQYQGRLVSDPGHITPNGNRATFRSDNRIGIVDKSGQAEFNLDLTTDAPRDWATNEDASRIAVVHDSGRLSLFREEADPSRPGPMPHLAAEGLRMSADGSTLLARDISGRLYVASIAGSGNGPAELRPVLPEVFAEVADLTPDGSRLLVAREDGTIDVLDASDATRIFAIAGHGALLSAMAVSPDGAYLASASIDGRLRLTDLARARRLAALPLASVPSGPSPRPLTAKPLATATPSPSARPAAD